MSWPERPTPTPDELARDYRSGAREYVAVAKLALAGMRAPIDFWALHRPINFLLGQACELALKALLLERGWTEARLRQQIGHDLKAATAACEKEGVTLRVRFVEYCLFASEAHLRQWFRYAGSAPFLDYDQALATIERQLDESP